MSKSQTLLVTGASGHLGQRVVELLLEAGHHRIIATTRSPEKLSRFRDQGVEVRRADFDEPDSLAAAFAGADRLLLISTDAVGVPGQRLAQHIAVVKAAEAAGVRHVLYTSIQNPAPDSPVAVANDHRGTEEALQASGMSWTFLRPNLYTSFLVTVFQAALQSGVVTSATGDGKVAFVTREDLARVSAAALAQAESQNRTLDVTGPEALTFAEITAIGAEVFDRKLVFKPVSPEEQVQGMTAAGLPEPIAHLLVSFEVGIAQGFLSETSTVVRDLGGQAPMSIRDYLISQRETLMPAN